MLGVLAIDVRLKPLRSICRQLYNADTEELYLVDRHGMIIYSGNEAMIGTHWKESSLLNRISNEGVHGVIENDTALHVYGKLDAKLSGWTLVKKIPNRTLYLRATRLTQINVVIASAALLLAIVATLWISIKITEPIKRLTRYINQIQSGQLDVDIRAMGNDEIGVLSRRFREMMVTINNLILREYKLDLANKTHQLKALQAQINPHFLYNTLQSIGTLALQHEVPRIYSLLSSLAKMLRYNMRDHTVDEEPDSSEQDSIGLRNVLLRIQLHSEDGANTLSVDNMVPHGVRYTLEIRTKAHTGIQIKGE